MKKTNRVFTPSTVAVNSFIERDYRTVNQLVDALNTPGKQIVIYGYSGCGKSTLLYNKLNQVYENSITTRCMSGMTYENIIIDAFDKMDDIIKDTGTEKSFTIKPEVSVEYAEIKSSVSLFEYKSKKSENSKEILAPQLTASRLGKFFGEANCCWVLEDFHKITGDDKVKISQLMKIFMDMAVDYPELKIIALGAVGTAREVVLYDHELNNRVSEVLVKPMEKDEIKEIISSGEKQLNVKFSESQKNRIAEYSCGLPSICHQLCLNVCFINKVYETQKYLKAFTDEDLDQAIEKMIEEKADSYKSEYSIAVKDESGTEPNPYKEIIKSALTLNKTDFSIEEITGSLKGKVDDLRGKLDELSSVERAEILIYNEVTSTYRFNNLFIKNYALMNLSQASGSENLILLKEQGSINKLLDIIHKDLGDEFEDILFEE